MMITLVKSETNPEMYIEIARYLEQLYVYFVEIGKVFELSIIHYVDNLRYLTLVRIIELKPDRQIDRVKRANLRRSYSKWLVVYTRESWEYIPEKETVYTRKPRS